MADEEGFELKMQALTEQLGENEQLVILRLSKLYAGSTDHSPAAAASDWRSWVGRLKDSPSWNGDALGAQQEIRREWD